MVFLMLKVIIAIIESWELTEKSQSLPPLMYREIQYFILA